MGILAAPGLEKSLLPQSWLSGSPFLPTHLLILLGENCQLLGIGQEEQVITNNWTLRPCLAQATMIVADSLQLLTFSSWRTCCWNHCHYFMLPSGQVVLLLYTQFHCKKNNPQHICLVWPCSKGFQRAESLHILLAMNINLFWSCGFSDV